MPLVSRAPRGPGVAADGLGGKLARYSAGSVVATVCSEVTMVLLYGPLGVAPVWAAVFAWLAGAVPNYWLNRSWTWRRTGRPGLRDELLPYAAIIGLTLLIATVATQLVDTWLRSLHTDDTLRVTAVGAAFLGVYVVMFGVRFVLLDGMFRRLRNQGSRSSEPTLGHP